MKWHKEGVLSRLKKLSKVKYGKNVLNKAIKI